jgi:hypothetical protein
MQVAPTHFHFFDRPKSGRPVQFRHKKLSHFAELGRGGLIWPGIGPEQKALRHSNQLATLL